MVLWSLGMKLSKLINLFKIEINYINLQKNLQKIVEWLLKNMLSLKKQVANKIIIFEKLF
jgi:hypothetical protein